LLRSKFKRSTQQMNIMSSESDLGVMGPIL